MSALDRIYSSVILPYSTTVPDNERVMFIKNHDDLQPYTRTFDVYLHNALAFYKSQHSAEDLIDYQFILSHKTILYNFLILKNYAVESLTDNIMKIFSPTNSSTKVTKNIISPIEIASLKLDYSSFVLERKVQEFDVKINQLLRDAIACKV
jgi:hypothetical protein